MYGYEKNRSDALQMPINFYLKNKEEGSQGAQELRFAMMPEKGNLTQNIKKFFQCVTYVGCQNLSHIFIQIEDRLYFMNVLPCLESFAREWLQTNSLLVH